MSHGPPKLIAVSHDDYHAKHVGHTADGRQFFLTTPFEPAIGDSKGSEFVALFLFDRDGTLVDAKIDDFGPRESLDKEQRRRLRDSLARSRRRQRCGRFASRQTVRQKSRFVRAVAAAKTE